MTIIVFENAMRIINRKEEREKNNFKRSEEQQTKMNSYTDCWRKKYSTRCLSSSTVTLLKKCFNHSNKSSFDHDRAWRLRFYAKAVPLPAAAVALVEETVATAPPVGSTNTTGVWTVGVGWLKVAVVSGKIIAPKKWNKVEGESSESLLSVRFK